MTATVEETQTATEVFITLNEVELSDPKESWKCETRLDLLAWEIARYTPGLANRLAEAGRNRFSAA